MYVILLGKGCCHTEQEIAIEDFETFSNPKQKDHSNI
jgi:hypothetical protein